MVNDPGLAAGVGKRDFFAFIAALALAGVAGVAFAAVLADKHRLESELQDVRYELVETQWQRDHCQSAPAVDGAASNHGGRRSVQ